MIMFIQTVKEGKANGHIHWQISKKVILICSIVIVIVLFIGYFNYICTGYDKAQIPSDDIITKINIESIPDGVFFEDFEISDKEDIETIVDFLNGMYTTKVKKSDIFYGSSGYHLEFYTQDNQIVNIALAEPILTVDGKEWEVSYEQGLSFDRIMAEIIYKRYHNDVSYVCLKGKVRKIDREDEETYIKDAGEVEVLLKKRMCIIDTDNKKIDISYSYIFDFKKNEAFSGPKKGDQVEIYIKAGEKNAKAIFILNY